MRFKRLITFGAFLSTLLFSCDFNEPQITKFRLTSAYYEAGMFIELEDKESFDALITNKESFVVYQYLESCMACYQFTPVLTEFVESNFVTIFKLDASIGSETILKNYASIVPTVFLFENGRYKTHLDPTKKDHASAFSNATSLFTWFDKYLLWPEERNE